MTYSAIPGPTDLTDFLMSQGWAINQQAVRDGLYVLNHDSYDRRQLVFPIDQAAPDYADSVDLVVEKLAELQKQPARNIWTAIHTFKDDVIGFRLANFHNETTIPFSFAKTVLNGSEQILKAAACTATQPQTYYPRLTYNEAQQLIDHTQFQHTAPGSFIFNVSCPVDAFTLQNCLDFPEKTTPFVRQATLVLYQGLQQLIQHIQGRQVDILVQRLKQEEKPFISGNLCDALSQFHDDKLNNSVSITINWSRKYAVPDDILCQPTLLIPSDYFSSIKEISQALKPTATEKTGTFIGTVEQLNGAPGPDGQRAGEVILALMLPNPDGQDGQLVKVKAILNEADYAQAVSAHNPTGKYIQFKGQLHPKRQPWDVTKMESFTVLG